MSDRWGSVIKLCGFCEQPFKQSPSRNYSFCSIACRREGQAARRLRICEACEQPYLRVAVNRRFCSLRCAHEFQSNLRRLTAAPAAVPNARWIPLTRGAFALVDEVDSKELSQHIWACHSTLYPVTKINGEKVKMHELLFTPKPGEVTDHINGNPLDNRRSNLRSVTPAGNRMNSRRNSNNTSGFKGVVRSKSKTNPWSARINVSGVRIHLGTFPDPEQAALAYDEAAKRHFGEVARTNFG